MNIKLCTAELLPDLQYICKKTFSETFAEHNSEEDMQKYLNEAYSLDRLKSELSDKNSITFLAYNNEKVVGYLKINKGSAQTERGFDDSLEIQRIYMANEAKGQGIGSEFMKIAENQAKEWNLSYMWLGVWENNFKARKFYESKGFSVFSKHTFVLGNDEQTDLLMKKELSQNNLK